MENEIKTRILILDGAMGTMIQQHNLTEKDYRGTPARRRLCPMSST
jgi:5-methyltetrahydrofolate--homocysteine methyltransferase